MGERLLELLFKYKPFVFARGEPGFGISTSGLLLLAALAVVGVLAVRRYASAGGRSTPRARAVLGFMRLALLALVLLCLARPQLIVQTATPQQNFVGVLLDDSASMRIADTGAGSRLQQMQAALAADAPLRQQLEERFKLRFFGFDSGARRLADPADLTAGGDRTDLAGALQVARDELAAVPLAALLVVSDGADNSGGGLTTTMRGLGDAGVAVFTVGVGAEEFSRDVEIVRVDMPGRVLRGAAVGADVLLRQRGYDGEQVELSVLDNGRLLASVDVELPAAGEAVLVKTRFLAEDAGPRNITYRVALIEGEMMEQNNRVEQLIDVRDDTERVLYLEGEPRFEVKFIRRAMEGDRNISIALLERTAANRFYRLFEPDDRFGGDAELYGGFPRSREELFGYSGIVLGSVEAAFFTPDQRQMIADFVSQRGGGLLALGGRSAFAAGGWEATPVAEALPLVLEATDEPEFVSLVVEPTLAGRGHPVVQLADDPEESARRWAGLPPLGVVNGMNRVKPGASLLLRGSGSGAEDGAVLAWQRFGAGKSIAFPVVDSWQWQMHHDVPLEDMTHETLWRQLLRWLVADVPGRVTVRLLPERFAPGDAVTIQADVVDDAYLALNGADVVASVVSSGGAEVQVPLRWNADVDGRYTGTFHATEPGLWRVQAEARKADRDVGSETAHGVAAAAENEFFGAEMNRAMLQRVANETGGRFYRIESVDALAADIAYADGGITVTESLDLWDMPIVFMLLVGLLAGEWIYRKRVRLA